MLSIQRSFSSVLQNSMHFFPLSFTNAIQNIYKRCVLDKVAEMMRPLFFSYFPNLISADEQEAKQLFADFWNEQIPLRPELMQYEHVRQSFTFSEQTFESVIDGEILNVTYGCIETKGVKEEDKAFNLVHALGIDCTPNNDLMHTLPLLEKFVIEHPEKQGRFFLVSQYSAKKKDGSFHKHPTLKLAGKLVSDTLVAIASKYGEIDEVLAHSLGGIVTAAALPILKIKPKHLILDRSASSVNQLSSRVWYGPFCIHLPFFTGWNVDLGKEIALFAKNNKGKVKVTVIGTEHDHRFKGMQNLYTSPFIETAAKTREVEKLVLAAPERIIGKWRQHSLPLDLWIFEHVNPKKSSQDLLQKGRNLASCLLLRGLSTYDQD